MRSIKSLLVGLGDALYAINSRLVAKMVAGCTALPVWAQLILSHTWHAANQIFFTVDQGLNVLSNPFSKQTWADETLSCRCGRLGHRYPYKFWKIVIDVLFYPFQGPNHCVNAFRKEKSRYQFPPSMRD